MIILNLLHIGVWLFLNTQEQQQRDPKALQNISLKATLIAVNIFAVLIILSFLSILGTWFYSECNQITDSLLLWHPPICCISKRVFLLITSSILQQYLVTRYSDVISLKGTPSHCSRSTRNKTMTNKNLLAFFINGTQLQSIQLSFNSVKRGSLQHWKPHFMEPCKNVSARACTWKTVLVLQTFNSSLSSVFSARAPQSSCL